MTDQKRDIVIVTIAHRNGGVVDSVIRTEFAPKAEGDSNILYVAEKLREWHEAIEHNDKTKVRVPESLRPVVETRRYQCPRCEYTTSFSDRLAEHWKTCGMPKREQQR